ncbi:sodium:solute symporter family protein [Sulfolobus acidocaldarius]|uniref:Permease n=3 Tax=Sulfolobus acidocaldarius TaxID=2285 RepID=Q4JBN0_SULAC|nr:sodium:solute symporter [Sulfolobus acidocaldarius]AAY79799.1 permease [Sulfolobus acidocaldarius DSM 639]AGE70357.1 permease [Sulfolobus acidocaldarius N8]ALU30565.1 sodium:solute symporter [Sulfolobus acidocaldarius]ALU32827.1 sodium:solute symporter [Sulfolobus acidocaldarius]WCM34365.1 sodium:solute symporter [Sulfolobus acidocaldarius DSM 639]
MSGINVDYTTLGVFIGLFVVFAILGFYGAYWRKGDLSKLDEWGLGGRRLGWLLVWFLMGADLYTAYTFIAIPSGVYASGSLFFYAVPYVAWTFGIALLTMPRLWSISRRRGYITAADFVKDRFNNRPLSVAVALTGAVAELPYIALQIFGMQAVLTVLLIGLGVTGTYGGLSVSEWALIIAFIVLAAFTITSGLRGAALTAVFKDILIWITVLTVIIAVPLAYGGFSHAFSAIEAIKGKGAAAYEFLSPSAITNYFTLALGSAMALYLYPHSINGSLSAQDTDKLKKSTSLLPLYGVGLALLALFGILIYAVPSALSIVVSNKNGALTVPSLIAATMPSWFVGLGLVAIFVGGLVPAAIMAIGASNLLTRNVIGEFKKLSPRTESNLAKIISTVFKFAALAFIFIVQATYAVQLQLLGGILILQTLPAVFLGLYTNKLEGYSTFAGWIAGIASGVYMVLYTNNFGTLLKSYLATPYGPIYIGVLSLAINILVTVIGTLIAYGVGWRPSQKIKAEEFEVV